MYALGKRALDITASGVLLVIVSPMLFAIALILLFTGEGDVFYLQERIGFKNKPFNIIKFATMLRNSTDLPGGNVTLAGDKRVTRFGRVLRLSKLNEVPQILNVLKGDMSLVGPRPLMAKNSFDDYPDEAKANLYNVPPGLTGIASIAFRDEESLITDFVSSGGDADAFYIENVYPYKWALEKWYASRKSFSLDIKIMFLTAVSILKPKSRFYLEVFSDLPTRDF